MSRCKLKYFFSEQLTTSQANTQSFKIQQMVAQGRPSVVYDVERGLPLVIQEDGRWILVDGHHRRLWHEHYGEPMLCEVIPASQFKSKVKYQLNGRRKVG